MQKTLSYLLNCLGNRSQVVFSIFTVALVCAACTVTPGGPKATQLNEAAPADNNPSPLTDKSSSPGSELANMNMAVIPAQFSGSQKEKLQSLADYLTKTLSIPVKLEITKDYDTSVDLLVEGKVELAYLGPLTYIKARQRNPQVQPLVAAIDKTTGRPWYISAIVVTKNSKIENLNDLKGKRFAFVSKSSTSGYLVPSAHLQEVGIDPDRDFAEVKYAGSHEKAKEALLAGEVDAVANDKRLYLNEKGGKLDPEKYRIIWESPPIPNPPIVASSQVPPQLIAALKKALVNAPEGIADFSGLDSSGFTLAQDEDYTGIRNLLDRFPEKSGKQ